jgi:hypothetical protein
MPHENLHLPDQDLIMAADGELSPRRKAQIAAHLDACWSCRERMGSIEATISGFVRARNHELNGSVPSSAGPRALLRARLAEVSLAMPAAPRAIRRLAPAAAIFVCVVGAIGAIAIIFGTTVNAEGPKPKAGLTPGETRPITIAEICRNPQAEVITANIPEETRRKVFSEYGIDARTDRFEVDYLITPDLGGAQSIRNLWPQPYGARWNAHVKDELEQRLHQLVCEGKVDLPTAQHDIAADWIGAYRKYVGASEPRP